MCVHQGNVGEVEMFSAQDFNIGRTQRIHVWYIHLDSADFYGKCIGKYTITMHGSYGE